MFPSVLGEMSVRGLSVRVSDSLKDRLFAAYKLYILLNVFQQIYCVLQTIHGSEGVAR
jgi:hypothetical protein